MTTTENKVFWQWHVWDEEKRHWFFMEEPVIETNIPGPCLKEAEEKLRTLFPEFCQKYPDRRAIPGIPFEEGEGK